MASDGPTMEKAPRGDARFGLTALAIFAERALPPALPVFGLVALFLVAAWLAAFEQLEPLWRMALTLGFGAAIAVFAWPLVKLRWPSQGDIERRLDRSRPDLHRPLATLADKPVIHADPLAEQLWAAHLARAEKAKAALQASAADPRLREKDRYAFRAAALLALIAAAFVAGDQRAARVKLAFDWTTPRIPPTPPRLDAWIDPPAYTGRPPIFLSNAQGAIPDEVIKAPVGAMLTIRSTAPRGAKGEAPVARLDIAAASGLEIPKDEPAEAKPGATKAPAGVSLEKRIIRGDALVKVSRDGREIAQYRLAVIPDLPPGVMLKDVKVEAPAPDKQSPGGVRITYDLTDDYGIAKAELLIEQASQRPTAKPARTLFPPPAASIPLRLGAGDIVLATEDHPWAGEEVRLKIRVEDDLGQSAESEAKTVTLPGKPFSNGVAKALIEQRRNLTFSPDKLDGIRLALDAMLFEPERFTPNIGDYLALNAIRSGIRSAKGDERLREISGEMYELALYLENGDMTEAEKRLREAEARLREAIERGAPPEEIKRLAEELRRAMDQFLREFAERALKNQDRNAEDRSPIDPNRMLTQRDLNEMLKKIEEMARSGNMAEAQRLLDQLKRTLDNLRSAERRQVDPRMRELGQQLEELDKLQREQRDLRDRTFREGQQQRQQGQRGQQRQQQQGQNGQQRGQQKQQNGQPGGDLQDQQQALRERLKKLRERLQQRGMQENEGMGEAEQGMDDADNQLGQGQPGDATEGQQRALDGMGKAAQGMAQEMQRQLGQGDGEGEGEPGGTEPGPTQRGRAENRMDPLGRAPSSQRKDLEDLSKLQNEAQGDIQGSISERAERVLKELRRRLGEFERPREELEYLERLLRQR